MEKLKTVLLVFLFVLMLTAASIYIGGSQFAAVGAAVSRTGLPAAVVRAGETAPQTRSLAARKLLLLEAFVLRSGEKQVGAAGSDIPGAATELALPLLHEALGADATLQDTDKETLLTAAGGNFLFLKLPCALPYQLLFALTGDTAGAAASATARCADTLLISVDDAGNGRLYLSDGSCFAVSDKTVSVRTDALSLLADSDALTAFTLTDNLVPVGDAPISAFPLLLEDGSAHPLSADAGRELLSLFDFNADRHRLSGGVVVEPHGSLTVTNSGLSFAASREGGISASAVSGTEAADADPDIYTGLTAAAIFVERLRTIAPEAFGGAATPFLKGFYKCDGGYTIRFGLAYDGIEITGDAVPYLAELTVSDGRFTAVEVRRITAARTGLTQTLFSAAWQYSTAAKHGGADGLHTLRLFYRADELPLAECGAAFYCDRTLPDTDTLVKAAVLRMPAAAVPEAGGEEAAK